MFNPQADMPRQTRRHTLKGVLVLLATALVCIGVVWQWETVQSMLHRESGDLNIAVRPGRRVVKVIVQEVVLKRDDQVFEAVGTARAQLSAEIYPQVTENVTQVHIQGNERVSKGDLLVQLDDREEQLALRLARIRLRDARARLDDLQGAAQKGAVPRVELERAQLALETAQIERQRARLALDDRCIRAPFDGVIGVPSIDPGDRVTPQTLIAGLDDRRTVFIDFELPEALMGPLLDTAGQQATVTATTPTYPNQHFKGTVTLQESRVDAQRRTLMARAQVDNSDDRLRPGMSFKTRWESAGQERPTVPEIALQWGREGSFIWAIRGGQAHRVPVRVVERIAGQIMVEGDLSVGESVVVEGLQRLRPGAAVEVLGTRNP
ncbi:MAG: efflux RND transporter periplasmic adaptor subunit [Myxococcota bacterium]